MAAPRSRRRAGVRSVLGLDISVRSLGQIAASVSSRGTAGSIADRGLEVPGVDGDPQAAGFERDPLPAPFERGDPALPALAAAPRPVAEPPGPWFLGRDRRGDRLALGEARGEALRLGHGRVE